MVAASAQRVGAEEYADHKFDRQELSDVYYSEGIGAGDLNGDGQVDMIYGPYWFAGPDFKTKHEIYPPKPQNRDRYADHFFAWVYDFNGDGRNDILTAGFPGTPGFVYENPGPDGYDKHWKKHTVVDSVANESPQFVNIVGDEKPELVCSNHGFFGYATWDPAKPFEPWKFTAVSEKIAPDPFGHGLGDWRRQWRRPPGHHHAERLVRAAEVARREPTLEIARGSSSLRPAAPRCTPTTSTATATTT